MIIYVPTLQGKEQLQCPNLAENPFCTCYIIDKGLRLKCPNAKPDVIRNVLLKTKGTINALTLYDFEKSVTELNISTIIPSHVKINNLEITRSGLTKVIPSVFQSVRKSLVSLKIVASKLNSIPHETLIQLFHIETIDFQLNDIKYLQGNAFKDLKLKEVNLRGNKIANISENAFLFLEKTLAELDLSENFLETFPLQSLIYLKNLTRLRVLRNKLNTIPDHINATVPKLITLDLSSNVFSRIDKNWFKSMPNLKTLVFVGNEINLRELYLNGNRLTVVTTNLFAKLRKISHIDLSRNDFQVVQMKMLDHIETQIESISFDENPLDCDCITQKLWRWMHDHHKIILKGSSHLRCKNPEELHGLSFLEITPQKLCDIPVVVRIALQDIQTYSVLVSWQSRHQPGLNGYQVAYFGEHMTSIVRGKILNSTARTTRLNHLTPGARYVICVIAIVDFDNTPASTMPNARIALSSLENSGVNVYGDELIFTDLRSNVMNDSHISKCTTVSTLEIFSTGLESPKIVGILEIVTRRLSLVVGCCISLIVFVVFASVLGYVQKKKRPVLPKIEVQQPVQYRSYDNFAETNLDSHSGNLDINTISTHISI
ncbi:jg18672 [Pararge aegeria aegeria]|uniref:Jg18672 protein n=1 Tax=Pararge aegeria aegeria TaxID=348720 RepID=A0A8S4RW99_9NEOP|nr:jg18672 [Pararge aegeria aegeria]